MSAVTMLVALLLASRTKRAWVSKAALELANFQRMVPSGKRTSSYSPALLRMTPPESALEPVPVG